MEYVIDFMKVGDADSIIIWGRQDTDDIVIFVDGGKTGDGEKAVEHFNCYIEPHLNPRRQIGFINSHPHKDHIRGLLEIVEALGEQMEFGIYNDPVSIIDRDRRGKIYEYYLSKADADIVHLYETFEDVEKLGHLCAKYNIKRYDAFSDNNHLFEPYFKVVAPSKEFYTKLVSSFTDLDHLFEADYSRSAMPVINEEQENLRPCLIVDAANDASPENLSSTVIELVDGKGSKYLLTSDAGIDSFEDAEANGYYLEEYRMVQLPHHGSRRNVSSHWLHRFKGKSYIASAAGNAKHPRKAVINCIRRNVIDAKVYSTHKSGSLSYTTNRAMFPKRGWSFANEV